MEGKWLSILEFVSYKNKSISTVRRYIKANRVKYKEDNGKYLIWVKNYLKNENVSESKQVEIKFENERLKKENRILKEELSELRMLIDLYESQKIVQNRKNSQFLPELPLDL